MQPPPLRPDEGCLVGLVLGPPLDCLSSSQVLIIGGGDGGVLREVVKHSSVESVVQCEIDEVSAQVRDRVWVQVLVYQIVCVPLGESLNTSRLFLHLKNTLGGFRRAVAGLAHSRYAIDASSQQDWVLVFKARPRDVPTARASALDTQHVFNEHLLCGSHCLKCWVQW